MEISLTAKMVKSASQSNGGEILKKVLIRGNFTGLTLQIYIKYYRILCPHYPVIFENLASIHMFRNFFRMQLNM